MIWVNMDQPPFRRRAYGSTRRLCLAMQLTIAAASAGCATVPDADQAPLTAEQRTKSDAIVRRLQMQQREFFRAHGRKLRELRKQMQSGMSLRDLADEDRERLQAAKRQETRVEEGQRQLWALLTETQRVEFQKLLADRRAQRAERRSGRDGKNEPARGSRPVTRKPD